MTDEIRHPVFAACYDPVMWIADRTYFAPYRRRLAACPAGVVVDLGSGTGSMLPYFAEETARAQAFEYHAVEPDPHMRKQARRRARAVGLPAIFHDEVAEQLPFEASSVDIVIASLVFCTVDDPERALAEVCRVLRPGGEFRLFEHVRADRWQGRFQAMIAPVWQHVAGGCNPSRPIDRLVLDEPTLHPIEFERISIGIPPIRPFVFGRFQRE